MEELSESSPKERNVVSPELGEKIASARAEIMADGADPQKVAARNISEMGFMQALWETTKPHAKKMREISLKQFKASISAAISLVPLVGEVKAGGAAVKAVEAGVDATQGAKTARGIFGNIETGIAAGKAARAEGKGVLKAVGEGWKAKGAYEAARANDRLMKLVAENPFIRAEHTAMQNIQAVKELEGDAVGLTNKVRKAIAFKKLEKAVKAEQMGHAYAEVATQIAGKGKGALEVSVGPFVAHQATRAKESMHTIAGREAAKNIFNLTPDVPHWLTLVTSVAEMVGVHGADLIPAVMQMGKNTVDAAKTYGAMGRDVMNLAVDRLTKYKDQKDMDATVRMFSSKQATPAAV
jgi:hypothetical protein